MKIALSTSVMQRGKSGVGQYVLALVRALLTHADRHRFVLFVLEEDVPLFAFAADRMEIVPVSERFRPAVRNIWWHQTILPRLVRSLGIDVLHVPSYRRLVHSAPCARVGTIHDLAPFHVRGKYDAARMFYGRVVVKRLAARQDAIVAVSANTARDVERFFGIPVDEQTIVPNGIDHARFHPGEPATSRAAAAARWSLHAPYFLFVSRLEHPAKNHVRLIEAFNRFKARTGSPHLLALGGSDWHGAEVIRQAAASSPCATDIRFLGFVDDAALPDLYRGAEAMVYPSLFEGFGLPPIEAMACGCPVVSSTRGALAEVLGQAAEVIDPEDVESIAAGLERIRSDGARREELRALGRRHAERFDWATNARQVVDVYERAFHSRQRAA